MLGAFAVEPSRVQGSLLPGRGNTDVVTAAVVVPGVDAKTLGIEVANVDAVTVRVESARAHIFFLEQTFLSVQEMPDDRIDHDVGFRGLVGLVIE